MKLEPHLGSKELENLYRKARDPVARSHYQIVRLIGEGKTTAEVMEVTGYSRGRRSGNSLAAITPKAPGLRATPATRTPARRIGRCSTKIGNASSPRR